jgi:hypothetical protein
MGLNNKIIKDEPVEEINISDNDITGDVAVFIPETSTLTNSNNNTATAGNNSAQLPPKLTTTSALDAVSTSNTVSSTGGSTLQFVTVGDTATGGSFTPIKQGELPTVYFNFKENAFYDGDLIFRFKTNNLTSTDFTGSTISTWNSDSTIRSGLTLTGTNKLKVVKAYDKYFYELSGNSEITNSAINLPVKTNPSYTILVFALGANNLSDNDDYLTIFDMFNRTNVIHKFVHNYTGSSYFNPASEILNIGKQLSGYNLRGSNPNQNYFGNFVGGTLNSFKYLQTNGNLYTNYVWNNPTDLFWDNFATYSNRMPDSVKYNSFNAFNIRNLRNDITNPTAVQDFQLYTHPSNPVTNMQMFSLFFVEMFTYITDDAVGSNYVTLNFETYINGQKTFAGKQYMNNAITIDNTNNYLITLSNKNNASSATTSRMFLFDYMHGSATSISNMRTNSKKIIESLCYDYKNIFLKKTTDLQISDGKKSLLFAPKIPHPYLNMYFTSAST